jgi:Carbohydrate-selective porin, OprB family/S-layer homology domain
MLVGKIYSQKLLAAGLVSCSVFSPYLLSQANELPSPITLVKPDISAAKPGDLEMNSELLIQQTSVSELSDIKPTDWAYQALRSLMERYGVITGYKDDTFRGNNPVTRDEFAAGLAATLDKVDGLIVKAIGDPYIQEDIITLRRLQREHKSILNELKKSVDAISNRTTQLQANQFSTTTKLGGQIIIALTDGTNAKKTIVNRTRLTLSTSFHQQDLLVTQLESGNNGGDAITLANQKNPNLLENEGLDYTAVEPNLHLRRLSYSFSPLPDLAVTVGAKMSPRDFIDRNRYANNEAVDFSSSVLINNPLIVQNQIDRNGGAGVAITWHPQGGKFTLRSLYIAANVNQPNSTTEAGLFGDGLRPAGSNRYQGSLELEYSPSNNLSLRLQYTNALINNTNINAFGLNGEYALSRNTGIFARLGVGKYQGFNTAINQDLDLYPLSWAIGLSWHNLFIPRTVAGIGIGQPLITDGFGNATQTNFEAFYNLALNENFTITPTISLVSNPNNDSSQGTIWQTTLRTVFSF